MDELLELPKRRRIYDVVGQNPGASAREIQRLSRLAWGETAYHLDQLTKAGLIRRERGGRRDYYFRLDMTWEDRKLLFALRSETERRLLMALSESPGLTLSDLQARTGFSLSTESFHLAHLRSQGLVERYWDGALRRYRVTRPERLGELLRLYQESFRDRTVDRFVEVWSSLLR